MRSATSSGTKGQLSGEKRSEISWGPTGANPVRRSLLEYRALCKKLAVSRAKGTALGTDLSAVAEDGAAADDLSEGEH